MWKSWIRSNGKEVEQGILGIWGEISRGDVGEGQMELWGLGDFEV